MMIQIYNNNNTDNATARIAPFNTLLDVVYVNLPNNSNNNNDDDDK